MQPYAVSDASCPLVVGNNIAVSALRSRRRSRNSAPAARQARRATSPPAFRALLRTRVRHRRQRFKPPPARSSLGLLPSRVLPPAAIIRPSADLPSGGYAVPHKAAVAPTTGSRSTAGLAHFPKEAADPPGVPGLVTLTTVRERRGSGVTSSGIGVRRRPLVAPSLSRLSSPT